MKLRPPKGTGDEQLVAAGILTLIVFGVLFVHLSASSFVTEEALWSTDAKFGQAKHYTLNQKRPGQPGGS